MLQGASNFRDIGGLARPDGRTVRHGRVFRSNHMADLTDDDLRRIAEIGIRAVFDLRGVEEAAAHPHRLPDPAPAVVAVSVEPRFQATVARLAQGGTIAEAHIRDAMIAGYHAYATEHAPVFARLVGRIADGDDFPVVIHCTAGKDRTGFATAMILAAVGIDRATIMADYLLTNERWRPPETLGASLPSELRRPLLAADAVYLETAFRAVDATDGGLEGYLESKLGLDDRRRARLEASLLV